MNFDTADEANFWSNRSSELYSETQAPLSAKKSNFTTVNDTDTSPLDLTRAVPVGIVLGAFILFAIVGNILVILSVVCNRHLRIPTNYFIINLAIADLLLGTTVLPVSATLEILDYWVFGRIFCDIWAAVDVLCCTASIMSLCVISIDRYIGVRYPLQYPCIVTEKRALLAMLGVWVLATVISIGPLLGWKQPPSNDDTNLPHHRRALLRTVLVIGFILHTSSCHPVHVYVVAKRTTKNLEAGVMKEHMDSNELTLRIHCKNAQLQEYCGAGKGQTRSTLTVKLFKFSREKKAAKTLGVVVGMFILCWLPFFLVLPIGSFNANLRPPETFFKVIFWLGYFNSCLNPIIYPYYSREFKQAFIRILKCRCHQKKKQKGWRVYYNHRSSHLGSTNNSYLNGSQQTLSSVNPSPRCVSKGSGSRLESGWGRGSLSPCPSLPGSPFTSQMRALPGAVCQSTSRTSRVNLVSPLAGEPVHANGQSGNGKVEHGAIRATPETMM
ncbi:unnamed protein product, partial [Coregonus sp. 'balchen']